MNVEELKQHIKQWRGSWTTKLTPSMQAALEATGEADLKRAAAILIHGPSTCPEGVDRPMKRISDGWQFCGNGDMQPRTWLLEVPEKYSSTSKLITGGKQLCRLPT